MSDQLLTSCSSIAYSSDILQHYVKEKRDAGAVVGRIKRQNACNINDNFGSFLIDISFFDSTGNIVLGTVLD